MSVHLASHLLVLLLVLPVPLVTGQASIPGIAAWKAAIQQHSLAEGQVVPQKAGAVPGLSGWEAHQRAVLEAEKRLLDGSNEDEGEENKREERVNTQEGLKKNTKAAILKLISKLSEKQEVPKKSKSKVETLLEEAKVKKIKEEPKDESFLDKLLEIYSPEEREKALQSVGKDDLLLRRLENKRKKKLEKLKSRPLRRKSTLGVLTGDYLERLANYHDLDVDYIDVPVFIERGRSSFTGAERSSKTIARQLRKLLRNSSR